MEPGDSGNPMIVWISWTGLDFNSFSAAYRILHAALEAPTRALVANAGYEASVVIGKWEAALSNITQLPDFPKFNNQI